MSNKQIDVQQWVEKYRPTMFDDVIGNQEKVSILRQYVVENKYPHILLYGKAGRGKTTLAYVIVRETFKNLTEVELGRKYLEINASDDRGIDIVRTTIKTFAMNCINLRFIILNEADSTTPDFQMALRDIMEKFPFCKFILTCNYPNKIIEPIRNSRCISFEIKAPSQDELKKKLQFILKSENKILDDTTIDKIITLSNMDIRRSINLLYTATNGNIDTTNDNIFDNSIKELTKLSFSLNFDNAIELSQNMLMDYDFKQIIFKIRDKVCDKESKLPLEMRYDIIKLLCETEYRLGLGVTDETLFANLIVCFGEITQNYKK